MLTNAWTESLTGSLARWRTHPVAGSLERHAGRLQHAARFAGTFTTLKWYCLRLWQKLNSGAHTASLKPRQVRHPLTVHLGGSSDMIVFEQIFIAEEYAFAKCAGKDVGSTICQ